MTPPSRSGPSAANEPSQSKLTVVSRKKKVVAQKKEKKFPREEFPIAMLKQTQSILGLLQLRELCDKYFKGCLPNRYGERRSGAAVTYEDADELDSMRDKAKLALKFYEKKAGVKKSLELMKVCKANSTGGGYDGLTFTAAERGSDEGLVFRAVFRSREALFCEVKDEISLVPGYVDRSKRIHGETSSESQQEENIPISRLRSGRRFK